MGAAVRSALPRSPPAVGTHGPYLQLQRRRRADPCRQRGAAPRPLKVSPLVTDGGHRRTRPGGLPRRQRGLLGRAPSRRERGEPHAGGWCPRSGTLAHGDAGRCCPALLKGSQAQALRAAIGLWFLPVPADPSLPPCTPHPTPPPAEAPRRLRRRQQAPRSEQNQDAGTTSGQ